MPSWLFALLFLVWIDGLSAADLLRIPLFPRSGDGRGLSARLAQRLDKRSNIGYVPLVDHVVSQNDYVDFIYLGQVNIGTPPQSFLVCSFPLVLH
jgi:hypothetical protein